MILSMRSLSTKGLAAFSLAVWLISGTFGQLLCLHGELDHHVHDYHVHDGSSVGLTHCHPVSHEHRMPAETLLPALPGFRTQSSPIALTGVGMPSWLQGEAISPSILSQPAALGGQLSPSSTVVLLI